MSIIKVYLSDAELEEVEANAQNEGMSVSTYVRKKLQLTSATKFSQRLSDTIALTQELRPGDFTVAELYSGVKWKEIITEVNAGQLGKQFYNQVIKGNVAGVSFKEIKNRIAVYTKA